MKKSEKLSEIQNYINKIGNSLNEFCADETLRDEQINHLQSEISYLKDINNQLLKDIESLDLKMTSLYQKIEQSNTPKNDIKDMILSDEKIDIHQEMPQEMPQETICETENSIIDISQTASIHENQTAAEIKIIENISEPLPQEQTEIKSPAVAVPEKKTVAEQFIHEKQSLNELFTQQKTDLNHKFQNTKVNDLTKAIGINDKFLFIKELFNNKGEEFSRCINQLNTFNSIDEAFDYLDQLKIEYFWETSNSAYLKLCDLLRRKFV